MTPHSASPESWRTDILSDVQAMLSGRLVPISLSGPSTVLGDPAGLLPCWSTLIVDVDGLDGPNGDEGFHGPTFERERTQQIDRGRH